MARTDVAVLEAGDATIDQIDGIVFSTGNNGAFDLRPGGHTIDLKNVRIRPHFALIPVNAKALIRLCLKARGGHRYRIKQGVLDGRPRVYIIDTATGEPPKTPCGPDEDDD